MEQIASTEAKTRFGELLRRLRSGESFIITQNGEEAGRLIPPLRSGRRRMTVEQAIAAIRALRPKKPLRREEVRKMIDDGRRF
jgi:prevent-host-death family protein